MDKLCCTLCNCEIIKGAEYHLHKSSASYSNISLMDLLQSCVKQELNIKSFEICKMCFCLLNELDSIRIRAQAIEDQLNNYISNQSIAKCEQVKAPDKLEKCTVCLKQINSQSYKEHLKKNHPELGELEPSFDFDEVNSISDINPSIEDINVLNNEIDSTDTKKTKKNCKRFDCEECGKSFKSSAELKNHMSSHSKERPYICEICGQGYKRKQALAVHVGMHNGINPYTCPYCNKSFTQKGALMRHTPIHTGELPYQCDLCGKRFVHHTSFNMHKLSHTGEKLHKCTVCGLSLMSGSHLKRHMRVHTGEKKFSCSICGKKFAERYNLAVHEGVHLGVTKRKKYQCHICDSFYNRQVKLEEHLLNAHQKIDNVLE